ncbi:uncharacterized protein LOC127717571 isoform X1 [Mytilus californianus]|uniref:uncharacterized protein LOC127717571 isoform X1 n=2 Tax=Mytilus californianus TaxID=6549 RepID=UPI002247A47C|nr:uncharacterized protein LOC127717571 isoform X1 [Mytilus californianus]
MNLEEVENGRDEVEDIETERVKMKKTGCSVSVYDGRKWPVIHCGDVIVSPEEKVSDVKTSIVSGNISKDKRKKSSKYALAVASSFGHVHAFLQDEDFVIDKIDSTTAEEKCLMLIKKPKSSSKKMFKSQSWANLSLSDSHLYNQPNYNTEGRKHKYRMRRKPSDLQTVPSESMMNLTDYGLRVDSYIPQQRDIKNRDSRSGHNRFSGVASPQSCHSDDVTYRKGKSCHSDDLTYRNGNMNGNTEINNNKLASQTGSRMYSSHMDIYKTAPKLSYIKEKTENCVIRSDEMYTDTSSKNGSVYSNDQDSVSRAHSVGDLSTGLTFSVVGQRKADSVHSLAISQNSTFKPVTEDNGKVKKSEGKVYTHSDAKRKESARRCIENKKDLQNTLRDLLSNISEKEKQASRVQNTSNEKRDSSTPVKPKRALPSVPQGQANDRKKHYTEIVKMRMSQHSRSGGQSSSSGTSSSVRTVQDTPLDKEVSDLLGSERESCPGMLENSKYSEKNGNTSSHLNTTSHQDTLNVSIPSSLRSCDSGQATITSLSSTVDSGYLTNDADNDMYSSVSYTKSLQRSAQNFYSKKAPVVHSQSLHNETAAYKKHHGLQKESAIEKGPFVKESKPVNIVCSVEGQRTGTFPRSSQSKDLNTSDITQENQKFKPQICDKLVKYSSMKHLPTNDLSIESQWSQKNNVTVGSSQIQNYMPETKQVIRVQSEIPLKDGKTLNTETLSPPFEGEGHVPVIESHYNTLPGNWKFQNNQNSDCGFNKCNPSLYQLSQSYRFIPVILTIGLEYNLLDHIHLCESCVELQNVKKTQKRESTAMSPPQGKYARLGGPGSAFKPVKTLSADTAIYSVISVQELSTVFQNKALLKGDILIEVNQKIVLGEPLNSVRDLISSASGELLLTVARTPDLTAISTQTTNETAVQNVPSTNEHSAINHVPVQNGSQPPKNLMDSQVEHLKRQVAKLNVELKRKNKAIRELNCLLPWTPNDNQSEINGNNDITLNGLSEDEFIV